MKALKLSAGARQLALALVLATALALIAPRTFGSHTCVAGNDDYDQCLSQTAGDEPSDVGSEPQDPWYNDDCEDGGCR